MNNETMKQLEKLNGEANKIYNTYRGKSLESINNSKEEFLAIKEMYNENMQNKKIGELTSNTEKQLEKYKSQYIEETRKLLDTYEKLRESEITKAPYGTNDKILEELRKMNLQKEYEFKYGIMEVDRIQQELSNIDNELEFNVAKYIAYNKADDKSIINMLKFQDKVLERIGELRDYLKLTEIQHGVYLVDGKVEYLITGKDLSDYFF